tara:strand:- start:204 stop:632 length:429 start_codon:yes stop_codon:yes gene_type:complete
MNEDNLAGSFLENMSPLVIRDHSSEKIWDYENAFYWFSHPTRLNLKEIKSIIERKKFENIELIQGDVFDTSPIYLDMDVMEPTLYVLDKMFDRIVPNGVIVFDDYNTVAGETKVVDQFLSKHKLVIEKHSLNHTPSYVIKTP